MYKASSSMSVAAIDPKSALEAMGARHDRGTKAPMTRQLPDFAQQPNETMYPLPSFSSLTQHGCRGSCAKSLSMLCEIRSAVQAALLLFEGVDLLSSTCLIYAYVRC